MPNWCENTLVLMGPEATLEKVSGLLEETSRGLFSSLLPGVFQKAAISNEEMVRTLGTKWDPEVGGCITPPTEEIVIDFQSPWGPPKRGVLLIMKKYNLGGYLTYSEPGVDVHGEMTVVRSLVNEKQTSYHHGKYEENWFSTYEEWLDNFSGYETGEIPEKAPKEYEKIIKSKWKTLYRDKPIDLMIDSLRQGNSLR